MTVSKRIDLLILIRPPQKTSPSSHKTPISGSMTSPTLEPPPIQSTTRAQCTREGVTAKYYRRNSGQVESSPLYSAWFREEIIADQRYGILHSFLYDIFRNMKLTERF